MTRLSSSFDRFATWTGEAIGTGQAFVAAIVLIAAWAITGPLLGFSEAWQLIVNTGTTILTWLFVFLLAHGENKHSRALQLKLDRILDALGVQDVVAVEKLDSANLGRVHDEVEAELAERCDEGELTPADCQPAWRKGT